MAKYEEGMTHKTKSGAWAIVQGGKWRVLPMGQVPRSDVGGRAHMTLDGDLVEQNAKGDTKVIKVAGDNKDVQTIQKAQEEASQANRAAAAAHEFMGHYHELKYGTGLPYSLPGAAELAQYTDPAIRAMAGINARYAPQLRPSGSGSLRVSELGKFYDALPTIHDTGDANAIKTNDLASEAARLTRYASFLSDYRGAHGNLSHADEDFEASESRRAAVPTAAPTADRAPHQMSDAELMKAAGLQ